MLITLHETTQALLRLSSTDEIAIAMRPLAPGQPIPLAAGELASVTPRLPIPAGHKIALSDIPAGAPVHRYGHIIGFATQPIAVGDHVHLHNLGVVDFARDYAFSTEAVQLPPEPPREWMGYRRADGRVGTRNVVSVIASVNCSAHVVRRIAARARAELLPQYPNVDDVIGIAHQAGCAMNSQGEGLRLLRRTLAGFAAHPNTAGFLLVGLGCEINQLREMIAEQRLDVDDLPPNFYIQDEGGTRRAIESGLAVVDDLLKAANKHTRTPALTSDLVVALQCGGSDTWSGITANPALGLASDRIVAQGGTVVLGETPEIYGVEHLLTRRAVSREVGEALVERIRWWEDYAARSDGQMDNNPSAGNKVGGLTTIYEKSLGAVAKAGHAPLSQVVGYAERITARGFVHMDTPGYDPVSATGQVAGGCTLIVFTTGRGSCFGFKPAPSIKIATNTITYDRMREDMDINAGEILNGRPLQAVADEIYERILAVASGQPSLSEALGIGEEEFNPWILGATM